MMARKRLAETVATTILSRYFVTMVQLVSQIVKKNSIEHQCISIIPFACEWSGLLSKIIKRILLKWLLIMSRYFHI
jgi:hypothetical protein